MMIPWTVDRRPDTGVTNVTLGIWLFLASEVMLFGGLFSAWALLATAAPAWPDGRDVLGLPFGLTHTAVLLALTAVVWRARARPAAAARPALLAATALAAVFLAAKSIEYAGEISAGLVPAASTFLATYWVLTGFHAAHVACGLAANLWALTGLGRVGEAMTSGRIRALALYWAFVDLVWWVLFLGFYL